MNVIFRIACSILAIAFIASGVRAGELPSDLGNITNEPWTFNSNNGYLILNGSTFPVGPQNFGGIPFIIPKRPNNYWGAAPAANYGSETVSVTVPVGFYGVTSAFTVLNTAWGQPGPNS